MEHLGCVGGQSPPTHHHHGKRSVFLLFPCSGRTMRKHDQGSEVPLLDVYSPKYKNLIIRYSKSLLFAFGFLSARFPAPSPALEMEHPVKVELKSILSEPLLKPLQIPEVSYVFSRLIPVFYVFRGLPFPCLRMPVNKCKVTALVMAISWHVGPIEIRTVKTQIFLLGNRFVESILSCAVVKLYL